jgi:hypothetical protein
MPFFHFLQLPVSAALFNFRPLDNLLQVVIYQSLVEKSGERVSKKAAAVFET